MRHKTGLPCIRDEQGQVFIRLGKRHAVLVAFERMVATLKLWQSRRRMRRLMARDLRSFTDAMLEDAQTTREQAEREVRKPFWRS
jgi:uncharacterized protein YjiS (DUF1127 family)